MRIGDLLICANRELALRRRVYPAWVQQGKMAEAKAQHEIGCMELIVELITATKLLNEGKEEWDRVEAIKERQPDAKDQIKNGNEHSNISIDSMGSGIATQGSLVDLDGIPKLKT